MVDVDPHGSLTSYFRSRSRFISSAAATACSRRSPRSRISDPASLLVDADRDRGPDLIPAAIALATLDRQSGRIEGMGLVLKRASLRLSTRLTMC